MTNTTQTTTVPVDVVEQYTSGDRAEKGKLRSMVTKARDAAVRSTDWETASDLQSKLDAMVTRTNLDRAPVDYAQLVANRAATFRRAAELLESGESVTLPEGTEVDFADLPDGEADSDMAVKLAQKGLGGSKGPKHDTGAHIAEVVTKAGKFLKVAQIANSTSEAYGTDKVSAGAVNAALTAVLDGKRTIEGIAAKKDKNGRLGAEPTKA